MRTVVVTGASGFIGRRLVAHLRARGGTRIVALRRSADEEGPCVSLEDLSPVFWRAQRVDSIDTVFHFAAYMPKNRSQADDASPIVKSNIAGTLALLENLPGVPRHLVFASTIDVYKPERDRVLDESSALGPATLYGASKVFGEQLVRSFARRTGCYYSILRIGHIFGPGEERFEKLIPNLVRAMLRGAQPELSGDGSTLRDFLYVDDAAAVIAAAGARNETVDPLNIVRGESISIRDVAERIASIVGYSGTFRYTGSNGQSFRFTNAAMRRILGIETFVPIDEGLAREIASFQR